MVSISACHAEDPGSIPGRGASFAVIFHQNNCHQLIDFTIIILPSFWGYGIDNNYCSMITTVFLFRPLQLMSALKSGEVANVRMATIIQQKQRESTPVSVDRSGGGL